MEPLYLVSEGVLFRRENTLYFVNKQGKRALPIHNISDIYCIAKVSLRSGAIHLLLKEQIPIHFFNKYGFYRGSLYPKEQLISGKIVIAQVKHYSDWNLRKIIASRMIMGVKNNVLAVLKYYKKKGKDLDDEIEKISEIEVNGNTPSQLLGVESQIWQVYYSAFNKILRFFTFQKREYRPPSDEINALISFGNSLLYATALSEIYKTYLHPAISYVHEPLERRFSLALDIADIFKPIIVERVIFNLVNNQIITPQSFSHDVGTYLNDDGRKAFIKAFHEKLETTIKHPTLKRKVSYRTLIRLEGYKLVKHVLGDKEYVSFKAWW